jgi:FkbM family methyltransferase
MFTVHSNLLHNDTVLLPHKTHKSHPHKGGVNIKNSRRSYIQQFKGAKEKPIIKSSGLVTEFLDNFTEKHEKCTTIYFDIGSNVGVQARKFFEPLKYPASPMPSRFDSIIGPLSKRRRSGCVIGVEANPIHFKSRLDQLSKCYDDVKKWSTHFFNVAAGNVSGDKLKVHSNPKSTMKDWGAYVGGVSRENGWVEYDVVSVDLTELISRFIQYYKPERTFLKMDIEGTEFQVLQRMVEHGLFCSSIITAMSIEWHASTPSQKIYRQSFEDKIRSAAWEFDDCDSMTMFEEVDDETYLTDTEDVFGGLKGGLVLKDILLPEECVSFS